MYTKEAIQFLLDQYITGSLSAEGREELHRIIRDPACEPVLAELMDEALQDRLAGTYHFPETEQRLKRGLLQRMKAETPEDAGNGHMLTGEPSQFAAGQSPESTTVVPGRQTPPAKRLSTHIYRLWPAAAAIVLLAAGAWLLQQKNVTQVPPPQATASPVPGGNKATLMLADGTVVPLDSSGRQQIIQGAAAILQQNGSLQYTAQGRSGEGGFNTLRTPRGGQFQVTLHDGTRVWLNSASSLRYPTVFKGKERVVELSGQGYFEIAPNAAHPFTVKINGATEVQVLGTRFDVMAYPDEHDIRTTLLQGAVRVRHREAAATLRPGQQAIAAPAGEQIAVRETDVNKVIDWKNGLFLFNNTGLPAILREVSRWYDVEIVYKAAPNKNLYGGGLSRKMALADVLLFLEEGGANHFKIEGKKVIVLP